MIKKILNRTRPISKEDEEIYEAIRNGPKSLRVVGRGTVTVDPAE